ncbi:MAG: EAL domain-containing protein [Polaromonas sp.]|nr:EAL domain-containing protein [Polaromonas sp.]
MSHPSASTASWTDLLERSAHAGCWTLNLDDQKLCVTAGLTALLELTQAPDWTTFERLFAPESQVAMSDALKACRSTGQPFELAAKIVLASGRHLWVRAVGQAVRDDTGAIIALQGVLLELPEKPQGTNASQRVLMQLSSTLASIKEAFVTLDREGRFTYVNPESERLIGSPSKALLGHHIWGELAHNGTSRLRQEIVNALQGEQFSEFETFQPLQKKWLTLRVHPFADGLAIYLQDVTERHHQQELLRLLQTSIAKLNDIVLIAEAKPEGAWPTIVFVNEAFVRLSGYSQTEVMGRTPELLQGPKTQRNAINRIRHALLNGLPVSAELICHRKNGDPFWLELNVVPVDYQNHGLTHWVAVGRDITARKASDEQIEHLAFYDPMTQLPNRQLLTKRLEAVLSPTNEHKQIGALMFIDLDNFKVLNDTLGHSRGDMMLQQVATRLQSCVRRCDTVARLGGDEFVVMLEDLSDDLNTALQKTHVVGEKILTSLSLPYDLNGNQYHGTCSIGITPIGVLNQAMGDALKQADLAMYQAKAAGRNTMCFFDPQMQIAATAKATLNTDLRQAFYEHQFVVHYQPQVGAEGQLVGVEALLRWQRPERLVMPDEFISQAEQSGLILPIGDWVLETACAQLVAWSQRPETAKLCIAVNVSVRQFCHPEFVDQVMALIQRTDIQASRLKLELTESLLAVDIDVTIAKMGMLKDAGVTLSIDDFGTGYSALSSLKKLPLDQLKICRTFVKDVLTNPNDAAIARTIIGLAQSLGLELMAEGVETQAQRDFLMRHGCDSYQGYLCSQALPIDQLDAFITAHFAARSNG